MMNNDGRGLMKKCSVFNEHGSGNLKKIHYFYQIQNFCSNAQIMNCFYNHRSQKIELDCNYV